MDKLEQRIKTTDSIDPHAYFSPHVESYRELQFKYKTLEHQYAVLENQFQLYSSETYNRIQSLERDMDKLVEQKDKSLKGLSLENKNIRQENTRLKSQITNSQAQVDRMLRKNKQIEQQFRDVVFTHQKIQTKQREIVMNYETELDFKINQLQNLKEILNNERITTMNKDRLIVDKANQIAELNSELKSLSFQLQNQQEVEDQIKDSNYRLKKQLEQLTIMFDEMEIGLKNCDNCRILQLKNMELSSILRNFQEKQTKKEYLHREHSRLTDNKTQVSIPKKRTIKKYVGDYSSDMIYADQNLQPRNMKDSVVKRCRMMLDKS